ILDNSFKPYAACHLTHPAVDAARALAPGTNALAALTSARIEVGGLANQITGGKSGNPATPLEGKFDLKYCIALGLHGHDLSAAAGTRCSRLRRNSAAAAPFRTCVRFWRAFNQDNKNEPRCLARISASPPTSRKRFCARTANARWRRSTGTASRMSWR